MIADVLANAGIMLVTMLVSGFIVFRFYKREKKTALIEIEDLVQDKLQGVLDSLGDIFAEIFTQPTVKKAFSIIGSQGGIAKADAGLVDRMATDVINGPQFAAIKMGAKSLLGVDVDQYVEETGAVQTLSAVKQIASLVGIDVDKALTEGLNGNLGSLAAPARSGNHPYL